MHEEELIKAIGLSEKEKYKQAINILNKLIRKDGRNQRALFERAYALTSIDDDVNAIEDLHTLLNINPNYPGARDWYAQIAGKNGNPLNAAEVKYQDLIANPLGSPGMGVSPQGWSDCAMYYLNAGFYDKGIEILTEYFEKYEKNVTKYISYQTSPMRTLSKLYNEKKEFQKALFWAEKCLASENKVPADYKQYIWTLFYNSQLELAKIEYGKYISTIHGGIDDFIENQPLKKALFDK
jgi:tetratricopeptide (TPR) repeat protein